MLGEDRSVDPRVTPDLLIRTFWMRKSLESLRGAEVSSLLESEVSRETA
jgi:hypothetical protein